MKEALQELKSLAQTLDNVEVRDRIEQLSTVLTSDYENLQTKLKLTTRESVGRKEKLNELYQKLNDFDSTKVKLSQYQAQIEKLSQYRNKAVEQKKMYNNKIKTLFDTKLANQNNKDYAKYKTLSSQFNFESQDQTTFDKNKQKYELLELAGTFGQDKLINVNLNKSNPTQTKPSGSRWNKTK